MKDTKPSMELLLQLCGEVRDDDGVDPRRLKKERQIDDRSLRDRRLCAEVKRCLDLVVPEALQQMKIASREVVSVTPSPDASRLQVLVSVNREDMAAARAALMKMKGRFRDEAALCVQRKRAPDLVFTVCASEEEDDDWN
jgi:ribosome-binding factor A